MRRRNTETSKVTTNEALKMALEIATIDELECYFQLNRNHPAFMQAVADLNRTVWGKEEMIAE